MVKSKVEYILNQINDITFKNVCEVELMIITPSKLFVYVLSNRNYLHRSIKSITYHLSLNGILVIYEHILLTFE